MDLLLRVILIALIIGVVIGGAYLVIQKISGEQITQSQATSLILHDLSQAYPNGLISITNVTPSIYPGSWHVYASIILNATSPCPTYEIYSFDYPKYGFVYRVESVYTSDCVVYGLRQNKSYIIGSYPVAIARSYSLSIPLIGEFVSTYGFANVSVLANFYTSLNFSNQTFHNVWVVNYSATDVGYSVYAILNQTGGTPLLNYTLPH